MNTKYDILHLKKFKIIDNFCIGEEEDIYLVKQIIFFDKTAPPFQYRTRTRKEHNFGYIIAPVPGDLLRDAYNWKS